MRILKVENIIKAVKKLVLDAAFYLNNDVLTALENGLKKESSTSGREVLSDLIENANIAKNEEIAICQDTGFAVFFVEIGTECFIDGNLEEAINEGTRQGYIEGYLRKSILRDPIRGINTNDNTPAVIWINYVKGDRVKISFAAKGGGSENMSEIRMMKPSDGVEGIKNFVVERVTKSGGNPCPPITVGLGIGGTFEKCAWLAKKSLLRKIGSRHIDPYYANLEAEILELVNQTKVGPAGFGGDVTALAVHIEVFPRHIATFPVAVNIQCHASRHKEIIL